MAHCGARPKWDFPPSCAELTGGSAPSPVAALVDVAETATAKTGGIRHGARKLLINVHTKTRNHFEERTGCDSSACTLG